MGRLIVKQKLKDGFTLIELLIVMTIIGVLIIIAINAAQYNITYSNDQAHKQYIVQVNQILSNYFAEHNAYPYVLCPVGGGSAGFDNGGNLQTAVYNAIPNTDDVYNDFTNIINKINAAGIMGNIGYCSSTPTPSAYVLFMKTATKQNCADNNSNNYFIVGDGTYLSSGTYKNYYDIPTDASLPISAGVGYGEACFKR